MKFDINKNELLRVLGLAGSFINSSSTLLVLGSVKFDFGEEATMLSLEATSLSASANIDLNFDNLEGTFKPFTVDHKDLKELVKLIDYDVLNFDVEKHRLVITTPFLDTYTLVAGDVDEFPVANYDYDTDNVLNMTTGMFKTIVDELSMFCGNDDLRPVMSSIKFESRDKDLLLTATDAHKLYHKEYKDYIEGDVTVDFLLPNDTAIKSVSGKNISIGTNDNNIIISGDSYTMAFIAVEGKYPNYEAVIPAINESQFVLDINKESFIKNIKIASIMTNKQSRLIAIEKSEEAFTIVGEDVDFQKKSKSNIKGSSDRIMKVGYNGAFLSDILSIVTGDTFILHGEVNRAGVIRETVGEDEKIEKTLLLMPVMLTNGTT